MTLTTIAEKLNMPVSAIEEESIRYYLSKKLLEIETELFSLASKYHTASIKDFDRLIKSGEIHETAETRDDFFKIDSLETKRDTLKEIAKSLR